MTDDTAREDDELFQNLDVGRRSVLAALGLGGAVTLGSGVAGARHDQPHPPHIHSHFGYAAPSDERLPGRLRPDCTVEMHIGGPPLPFHFEPMGIHVDPGDVVRFDAHSPDHSVTAYHEGHGRQQRVPDDAAAFSSPLIPIGGFWLYEFTEPGTYDVYCGPHQFFGMVMRIVVGDPDDPEYDGTFGSTGRPPTHAAELEALPGVSNWVLPTSADVFATEAMTVDNIVANGPVTRGDVVADLAP